MNELTYQKDGHDVKTSKFLRNRGTCCKTSCLHCPYGFTLKNNGLQFEVITQENLTEAKELAPSAEPEKNDIAASFLAGAFGSPKKVFETIKASNIQFDQLILEFNSWVHISFVKTGGRRECLVVDRFGVERVK